MGFELVAEPDLSREQEEVDTVGSLNTASRKMIHKTMTLNSIDLDMLLPELDCPSQLVSVIFPIHHTDQPQSHLKPLSHSKL